MSISEVFNNQSFKYYLNLLKMKTRFYLKGIIGLILLLTIAVGCNKEDEAPEFATLSFNGAEVMTKLPAGLTNSTDQYAQECVDMIEYALDMTGFIDNMAVPDDAQKSSKKGTGDTWTWTWEYGGESFTFHWTYDEDNSKRYWTMEVSFGGGPLFDYIEAWEMKDGSEGEVTYNFNWVTINDGDPMEDYVDLFWKYSWRLDSSGTYYFTWTYDTNDAEYDFFMRYEIVIYADGSGEIDYIFFDEPYYHMEWTTSGGGSWIYYFGGVETSGTWPAG